MRSWPHILLSVSVHANKMLQEYMNKHLCKQVQLQELPCHCVSLAKNYNTIFYCKYDRPHINYDTLVLSQYKTQSHCIIRYFTITFHTSCFADMPCLIAMTSVMNNGWLLEIVLSVVFTIRLWIKGRIVMWSISL